MNLYRKLTFFLILCTLFFSSWQPTQTRASYFSYYDLNHNAAFQELQKMNNELIGWLSIPGTKIDFPLLQTTNNDYYLSHNEKKQARSHGAIFMDYRNHADLQNDQTILYGHNVYQQTAMFSTLLYYEDQSYYQQHPYIVIATTKVIRYYKIFAAYTTHTNFYYLDTSFSDSTYQKFVNDIALRNQLTSLVSYQQDKSILTLSTCSFRFEHARFVIHAILIDEQ